MISTKVASILSVLLCIGLTSGFAPSKTPFMSKSMSKLNMISADVPPAAPAVLVNSQTSQLTSTNPSESITQGVNRWVAVEQSSVSSSSFSVSLQERKVPTKEELEAKKRNFNLIFWGGGFVAPFLATFFYFGFKFWEK